MVRLNIKNIDSGHSLVILSGELDTAATEQFADDLAPLMEGEGKEITVDLTELEFISSAGMRMLLKLNKNASATGGKVILKGMSDDIKQIFQLTGLDNMFEIV